MPSNSEIDRLREELRKERSKVKLEDEKESIQNELFRLRNRKEIAKQQARREKLVKITKVAKKVLRGTGRSLANAGADLNRARSQQAVNRRLETIHGTGFKGKKKGKKTKRAREKYEDTAESIGIGGDWSGSYSISNPNKGFSII